MRTRWTAWAVLATVLLGAGAAARMGRPGVHGTAPSPTPRGALGFDTGIYPGDDAMETWRDASPYTWVGYYLPSPCRRDRSWAGTRARLARQGWGLAVLYVGRQAWAHGASAHVAGGGSEPRSGTAANRASRADECTAATLSAARGLADGDAAVAAARREGFPPGTTIFLDVERMEQVPEAMRDYYRVWVRRVATEGTYRPGVYAHVRNADVVAADVADVDAVLPRHRPTDRPKDHPAVALWVAAPRPRLMAPAGATGTATDPVLGRLRPAIRQVALDTLEVWGGVPITVDVIVAANVAANVAVAARVAAADTTATRRPAAIAWPLPSPRRLARRRDDTADSAGSEAARGGPASEPALAPRLPHTHGSNPPRR